MLSPNYFIYQKKKKKEKKRKKEKEKKLTLVWSVIQKDSITVHLLKRHQAPQTRAFSHLLFSPKFCLSLSLPFSLSLSVQHSRAANISTIPRLWYPLSRPDSKTSAYAHSARRIPWPRHTRVPSEPFLRVHKRINLLSHDDVHGVLGEDDRWRNKRTG